MINDFALKCIGIYSPVRSIGDSFRSYLKQVKIVLSKRMNVLIFLLGGMYLANLVTFYSHSKEISWVDI